MLTRHMDRGSVGPQQDNTDLLATHSRLHARDMARRHDATTSIPLKTSFATPSINALLHMVLPTLGPPIGP
jgi:hypothetical protein